MEVGCAVDAVYIGAGYAEERWGQRPNKEGWVYWSPRGVAGYTVLHMYRKGDGSDGHGISAAQARAHLTQIIKRFPGLQGAALTRFQEQMKREVFISQGDYSACSFVGFAHLMWLNGDDSFKKNWEKRWRQLEKKTDPDKCAFDDIASMLDALPKSAASALARITYVPFRSAASRETLWNTRLPGVAPVEGESHPDRIKRFFDTHLAAGVPICFNHASHTRVAVCLDEAKETCLCIDSFGRLHEETGGGGEHWCAGVSTIDFNYLVQWVREAVIVVI